MDVSRSNSSSNGVGRRRTKSAAGRLLLALALLASHGCGGGHVDTGSADAGSHEISGTVTVFAAASLTEPFGRIGESFEAAYPGTDVVFNFAGSSTLAQQLNEGAPADVFASADPISMRRVAEAGVNAVDPTTFARNRLVIAVPAGNPQGVTSLRDLAAPGVKVALCVEQVPCGRAAQQALVAGGVELVPATLERDVKAVLAKLELGEVDAALVYRSDVRSSAHVAGVELPESAGAVNEYPISVLAEASNPRAAAAFLAHVLSGAGMAVLADAGFEAP